MLIDECIAYLIYHLSHTLERPGSIPGESTQNQFHTYLGRYVIDTPVEAWKLPLVVVQNFKAIAREIERTYIMFNEF